MWFYETKYTAKLEAFAAKYSGCKAQKALWPDKWHHTRIWDPVRPPIRWTCAKEVSQQFPSNFKHGSFSVEQPKCWLNCKSKLSSHSIEGQWFAARKNEVLLFSTTDMIISSDRRSVMDLDTCNKHLRMSVGRIQKMLMHVPSQAHSMSIAISE